MIKPPPFFLRISDHYSNNYLKSFTNDSNILSKKGLRFISQYFVEFQALATCWLLFGYTLTHLTLLLFNSDLLASKSSKLIRKVHSIALAESGSHFRAQMWQRLAHKWFTSESLPLAHQRSERRI